VAIQTHAASSGPILIADADAASVEFVCALLETVGYRTIRLRQGDEALWVARDQRPSVALLEIELPRMNGFELCRALRDEFGQAIGIAFVSATRTTPIDVSSGLLIGADDYLLKPFEPSVLLARVRALARRAPTNGMSSENHLTRRELETLRLLAEGLAQREIARALSISPRTVAGHIEHVLAKLGVHSRAQAVAAAYRLRLLDQA